MNIIKLIERNYQTDLITNKSVITINISINELIELIHDNDIEIETANFRGEMFIITKHPTKTLIILLEKEL
jgi:hypothetical protein